MWLTCPRCDNKFNSMAKHGVTSCGQCHKTITFDRDKKNRYGRNHLRKYRAKHPEKFREYHKTALQNRGDKIRAYDRKRKAIKNGTYALKKTGKCNICGRVGKTQRHHIIPRRFGSDKLRNLIELCLSCHAKLHAYYEELLWVITYPTQQEKVTTAINQYIQNHSRR